MPKQLPVRPNNDMTNVRIQPGMFGSMGRVSGKVQYRTGHFNGTMPWETPRRSVTGVDPVGEEFQMDGDQLAKAQLLGEKLYHAFVAGRFSFMANDDGKSDETPQMREEYWKFAITEPALESALWTKIVSVISNNLNMKPASKSGWDRRIADWMKDCLIKCRGGLRNFGEQVLYHGLVWGNVLCEPKWEHVRRSAHNDLLPFGYWTMRDFVARSPGDYRVEVDGFRNVIGIWSAKTAEWFDPSYFVYWANRPVYGNPAGTSSIRSCRRACTLLKLAHTYRGIYLEQFGLPMLKAKYPQDNKEAERLARVAIKHARSLGYILVPDGVEVEALAIASRGETEYQDAIDDYRKEIFLAQAGSYLYAMEGSVSDGAGNSETHRSTLDLYVWYLSNILEELINEQIIPWIMNINLYNADPPVCSISGLNDSDLKDSTEIDGKLIEWGVPLDIDEIYERYNRSPPLDASRALIKQAAQLGGQMGQGGMGGSGGFGNGQTPSNVPPSLSGSPQEGFQDSQGQDRFSYSHTEGETDYIQQSNWTCGPMALKYALSRCGASSATEFAMATALGSTSLKGTDGASLERLARQHGINAVGKSCMTMLEMSQRIADGNVVMTPIQSGGTNESRQKNLEGHWVVVTNFDPASGMVQYFDPTCGKDEPVWESISTFAKNWHDRDGNGQMVPNYAITMTPKQVSTTSRFAQDGEGEDKAYILGTFPEAVNSKLISAQVAIDEEDLDAKGLTEQLHVTILYGCSPDDVEPAKLLALQMPPLRFTFGCLAVFPQPEKDREVLVYRLYGEQLEFANYTMMSALEVESDYDEYLPHVTLAYLKPGTGQFYTAKECPLNDLMLGETGKIEELVFSADESEQVPMPLGMVPDLPILGFADDGVVSFASDGLYHGKNPPPGWVQVGTGPKGGKIWGPPAAAGGKSTEEGKPKESQPETKEEKLAKAKEKAKKILEEKAKQEADDKAIAKPQAAEVKPPNGWEKVGGVYDEKGVKAELANLKSKPNLPDEYTAMVVPGGYQIVKKPKEAPKPNPNIVDKLPEGWVAAPNVFKDQKSLEVMVDQLNKNPELGDNFKIMKVEDGFKIIKQPKPNKPDSAKSKGNPPQQTPTEVHDKDKVERELTFHSVAWQGTVPDDQLNAIYAYTGDGYVNMNRGLRTGTFSPPPKDAKGVCEKAAAALDTASLPDTVNAYRSINAMTKEEAATILKQFKDNIGGHIVDKAFVSTTISAEKAENWGSGTGNAIKCEMVLPKGSKAIYVAGNIAAYAGEKEVLVQRGSKFKVHSVEGNVVKLELVPA